MESSGRRKSLFQNQGLQISVQFLGWFLAPVFFLPLSIIGCAPKQMTLYEAMQTTISIRGQSFVPPPRSIDDVLGIIESENRKAGPISAEWEERLRAEAPANASKKNLAEHHYQKARAASHLGDFERSREELQKAYELTMPDQFDARIISLWANCELNLLNYDKAIALYTILKDRRRMGLIPYQSLAFIYALSGHFEKVESLRNEAMIYAGSRKLNPTDEWIKLRIEAIALNMSVRYEEAEPVMRKAIAAAAAISPPRPDAVQVDRIRLIRNLIEQNRLVEAELEARINLDQSMKYLGAESVHIMAAKTILAEVLLAQGRVVDAEKVNQAALRDYEKSNIPSHHGWRARTIETMCKILVVKGDYSGVMREYEYFRGMKTSNRYIYEAFYGSDKNAMLALLMTGRVDEALELIEAAYGKAETFLGKHHPQCAELLGLRGMARSSLDHLEMAYRDFSDAIPIMAASNAYTENRVSRHRFMLILEGYLNLLSKLAGSAIEKKEAFTASAKGFQASMLLGDSAVQNAVLASTARMSIGEPKLKELVRTEQDIRQQVVAYQNLLQSMLAKNIDEVDRRAVDNVKGMLDQLRAAREVIVDEIERQFPDYANLVNFRPTALGDLQKRLGPEEVIISIASTENNTYVFAVPPIGSPQMTALPIGKKELEELVFGIQKSLYPSSLQLGRLPPYDFSKAHQLYTLLLKPVERSWRSAKHIIFMVSGPAGMLPFGALTTEPFLPKEDGAALFAHYRDAPWLIRGASISTVPSASSFVALRAAPRAHAAKEAFAGFGDPFFNKAQMARGLTENTSHHRGVAAEEPTLDIRGIRLTKNGNLDDKRIVSCRIDALERLPDTAEELISLAGALGADPARDVYLGALASEGQVKGMDLSNRRVVAFASHALVPYDLDGLDQPAIALSAPSVTGEKEDGLLTMAEILDLKLDADWVVLSACNTGAADGAGAETVSGLGRAFFYAGTRAVLVSMWPVETGSAKILTTSLFRHMEQDPRIDKAAAHRAAMLDLIHGPGMRDAQGRLVASRAHPFFWAPFVVVGDHRTSGAP